MGRKADTYCPCLTFFYLCANTIFIMLKVGVIGAGHLGKFHIQQWLTIPGVQLMGFADTDSDNAAAVAQRFDVKHYQHAEDLIKDVDAIDIVAPTTSHYELAKKSILAGKHIFIEKPLAHTLEQARELVALVAEAKVKCQVGHIERYNPALVALKGRPLHPMFIESHRLAQFNPRGTDVSVVLDLMIHDIDIVLHTVGSQVRHINASGVAVVSQTADIVNARIEFDNGCVANLTASRISLKNMRKMRLFQRDAYIGIDFLEKKSEIVRLSNDAGTLPGIELPIDLGNDHKKYINIEQPKPKETNAIQEELADFAYAILTNGKTSVPAHAGYQAMEVAYQILEKIKHPIVHS